MLSEMGIQVVESEESEEGEAVAPKPLEAEDEEATEQSGNINAETAGRHGRSRAHVPARDGQRRVVVAPKARSRSPSASRPVVT